MWNMRGWMAWAAHLGHDATLLAHRLGHLAEHAVRLRRERQAGPLPVHHKDAAVRVQQEHLRRLVLHDVIIEAVSPADVDRNDMCFVPIKMSVSIVEGLSTHYVGPVP